MLAGLLYIKGEKVLAARVAKVLGGDAWGKGWNRRISLRPQRQGMKPVNEEQGRRIGVMLHLEQDPVQRIAEGQSCILNALDAIILEFKQSRLDPTPLEAQRDRLDHEVQRTQNLIRSLLAHL